VLAAIDGLPAVTIFGVSHLCNNYDAAEHILRQGPTTPSHFHLGCHGSQAVMLWFSCGRVAVRAVEDVGAAIAVDGVLFVSLKPLKSSHPRRTT